MCVLEIGGESRFDQLNSSLRPGLHDIGLLLMPDRFMNLIQKMLRSVSCTELREQSVSD